MEGGGEDWTVGGRSSRRKGDGRRRGCAIRSAVCRGYVGWVDRSSRVVSCPASPPAPERSPIDALPTPSRTAAENSAHPLALVARADRSPPAHLPSSEERQTPGAHVPTQTRSIRRPAQQTKGAVGRGWSGRKGLPNSAFGDTKYDQLYKVPLCFQDPRETSGDCSHIPRLSMPMVVLG